MNERKRGREGATPESDPPYDKAQSGSSVGARAIDPEVLHRLIAVAAYYRAERRGFDPGGDLEDWLNAEAEILAEVENMKGLSA